MEQVQNLEGLLNKNLASIKKDAEYQSKQLNEFIISSINEK